MTTEHPDAKSGDLHFTFFSNHAHVLVLIARTPDVRMRELAVEIGITERAVQRIVDDLTTSGYLQTTKEGRRNHYQVQPHRSMRHPLVRHCTVGDLINLVNPKSGAPQLD